MIFRGLLFLCLFLPFQVALSPAEGIDLASVRVFVLLLFLLWAFRSLKRRTIHVSFNLQTAGIISFLFFSVFSLFFAQNFGWGLRKFFFLASFFPLYFIVCDLDLERKKSLVKFMISGASLAAGLGIFQFVLQFFIGIDKLFFAWSKVVTPFLGKSFAEAVLSNNSWLVNIGGATVFRVTSLFPDPHVAAFYFGMISLVALGALIGAKNKKEEQVYLFAFILLILADFLTFSRGGYLGLFFGIVCFGLFFLKQMEKKQIKKIILGILVVFLLCFSLGSIRGRLMSSFSLDEGSNAGRIDNWKQSVFVIKENFFLGVGLGNYPLAVKPSANWREPIYSHNLYLDLFSEIGFFGLLSWFLVLAAALFLLKRMFERKGDYLYLGVFAALVDFSVHSFFETVLFSVHILPIFVIFIGISSLSQDEKKKFE